MEDTTNAPRQPKRPGRMERSREERILAGVAGGLGERFDLNPWWFRVGFIGLTLFGFAGLALYVAAWLLMPDADKEDSIAVGWLSRLDVDDPAAIGGIVLIGVAALILVSGISIVPGRYAAAALLLVVGVLLYRGELPARSRRSSDDPAPATGGDTEAPADGEAPPAGSPESTDTPEGEAVAGEIVEGGAAESAEQVDVPPAAPQSEPALAGGDRLPPPTRDDRAEFEPRRRLTRQASVLGRMTFALVLIAAGALAAADAGGWLFPEPVHYLAAILAVIGFGLLVGAVAGRARWLIIVGVLLIPPALVASVLPNVDFTGEVGERYFTVSAGDINTQYRLAAGSLTIDFREVGLAPQEDVAVDIEVGAGELIVIVPADAGLLIEASVGIGSLDLLGRQRDGIGLSDTVNESGNGTFIIDARTGFGTVSIVRREAED